jgi:zinc protease
MRSFDMKSFLMNTRQNIVLRAACGIFLSTLVTVGGVTSCAGVGKSGAGSASAGKGYKLPAYEEKTLENGLKVLFVPDQALPYINYSLLIRAGGAHDPAEFSGLSSMVASLLDKGTGKRSAPRIAEDLGQMGADFSASASGDYTIITASALSSQVVPLLDNLVEIVTQPAFSEAEVDRMRRQTIAQISRRVDNAGGFADLAFEDFLYGSHPYARPVSGMSNSVAVIKRKNVIQHYLRHYRPNNAILAVVGKYTPEQKALIEQAFASWKSREVPAVAHPAPPAIEGVQIRLVDKPGQVQTQIRVGHMGIKRQNEDFVALRVANTILGGAFASRLNNRVRKELGLTYSIGSYFDARQDVGPFEISTFTKNESTGQALSETLRVLSEFKANGATSAEVNSVKGYLKGLFPVAIETPEKLAFNLMLLRFYGVPDSYLENYLSDVDRLSTSDVNRVIRKYIDDKNLKVVVFGSAPQIQAQLEAIGKVEVKKASELQ